MTQPTGVFVRLPLSEGQRDMMVDAAAYHRPDDSHDKALLAIGTPVTGGDMPVITTLGTLRDPVPCVRQSGALAKLAEKDAEIARLNAALQSEDSRFAQTIKERDYAEEIIAKMYQAVMGDRPEWSSSFGYRDAVEDIVDYVHALRMRTAQKSGDTHLNNIATLVERARKNISIAQGGRKMARSIAPILGEIEQEVAILKGPEA